MSVFGAGPKRVLTIPANGLSRAHSRRERQPPASAHTPDVLIAPTGVVKEDFPIAVALNNRKSVQRTATLCNHLGQRWRTLCGREVGPATGGLRRRRSCKIPPAVGRRGWRVCCGAPGHARHLARPPQLRSWSSTRHLTFWGTMPWTPGRGAASMRSR